LVGAAWKWLYRYEDKSQIGILVAETLGSFRNFLISKGLCEWLDWVRTVESGKCLYLFENRTESGLLIATGMGSFGIFPFQISDAVKEHIFS
jgi:hypothetical protein